MSTEESKPAAASSTEATTNTGAVGVMKPMENHDTSGDHHDDEDHEDVEPSPEWDEGGPSHCGYHETVHDTLMSVGASVHSVVGDPPENVDSGMKQVGNWFQEASYAVRDFMRGDKIVSDDAADAFSSMHKDVAGLMGTAKDDEKKTSEDAPPANSSQPDPVAAAS